MNSGLKPITILLVEDDPEVREILLDLLELEDVRVIEAKNGDEAWEILSRSEFGTITAVVSDVAMPKMNGFELLDHVRGSTLHQKIPFILISGNPDRARSETNRTTSHQPDDFFPKPFDVQSLIKKIQNLSQSP